MILDPTPCTPVILYYLNPTLLRVLRRYLLIKKESFFFFLPYWGTLFSEWHDHPYWSVYPAGLNVFRRDDDFGIPLSLITGRKSISFKVPLDPSHLFTQDPEKRKGVSGSCSGMCDIHRVIIPTTVGEIILCVRCGSSRVLVSAIPGPEGGGDSNGSNFDSDHHYTHFPLTRAPRSVSLIDTSRTYSPRPLQPLPRWR